jgi:hypothetical protein
MRYAGERAYGGALATAATGFVAGAALTLAACVVVVAAYLLKSSLGIDLMAGHSLLHDAFYRLLR